MSVSVCVCIVCVCVGECVSGWWLLLKRRITERGKFKALSMTKTGELTRWGTTRREQGRTRQNRVEDLKRNPNKDVLDRKSRKCVTFSGSRILFSFFLF